MRVVVGHRVFALVVAAGVLVTAVMLPCDAATGAASARDVPREGACAPCLSGEMLVWTARDLTAGSAEIRVGQPSGGRTARLRSAGVGAVWHADTDGETLVWQDSSAGDGDILIYDIGGKRTTVIDGPTNDCQPSVWGTRVVFERRSGTRVRVMVYETDSESIYAVDELGVWDTDPDIYGDMVVFVRNGDIVAHDLASGRQQAVIQRAGLQDTPSVWKDRLVYSDWADGLADLRLSDLSTGTDVPLVSGPGVQYAPSVWGDTLAFEQYAGARGLAESEVAVVRLSGRTSKRYIQGAELTIHAVPPAQEARMPEPHVVPSASGDKVERVASESGQRLEPPAGAYTLGTRRELTRRFPSRGWDSRGNAPFALLVLCALMAGTLSACAAVDSESPYPEKLDTVDEATSTPGRAPTSTLDASESPPRRTDAPDDGAP